MTIVEITWVDSASCAEPWLARESLSEVRVATCTAIGYLVSRNKTRVVVAQSANEQQLGRVMVIPTGCVRSVRKLK